MTKEQRAARDAEIVRRYAEGKTLEECGAGLGEGVDVGRQRVMQILKKADVWKPKGKSNRTGFLGVSIDPDHKAALEAEAEQRGLTVSALVSEKLSEAK